MLQPNTIKPSPGSHHRPKRVGRGNASGHGTSSTRGGKGQTARSGGSHRLWLKGFKHIMQQTPKLRGFKSPHARAATLTLDNLSKKFKVGEIVSLATLKQRGLLSSSVSAAKIVSTGKLALALNIEGVNVSAGAKAAIEAAGGNVK